VVAAVRQGFTLLEIVLVLTLLALMTGAVLPTVHSYREDQQAREPLNELAKLAKITRLQAMKDRRPYQIVFTSTGFKATRYFSPYMQLAEIEEFIQRSAIETQQKEEAGLLQNGLPVPGADASAAPGGSTATPYREWTQSVALPEGLMCSVREWHETEPRVIAGSTVKLWVFQPSGMVTPITVTLQLDNRVHTVDFSALTADIARETSTTL
jgi:prepilin-type N-terminal cleavage/methylation domain-containing protein